jgi:hypothetical protein
MIAARGSVIYPRDSARIVGPETLPRLHAIIATLQTRPSSEEAACDALAASTWTGASDGNYSQDSNRDGRLAGYRRRGGQGIPGTWLQRRGHISQRDKVG